MREIKFRAWERNKKKMSEDFGLTAFDYDYFAPEGWNLRDMEIMQFTGLKDKNGKEIYEGDIVIKPYITPYGDLTDREDGRFNIGFEHGQFVIYDIEPQPLANWCKSSKGDYVSNYGNKTITEDVTVLEIIGNIYENPELLTNN